MCDRVIYPICVLCVLLCGPSATAATLYAKVAASGTGDCSSWANACTLSQALSDPFLSAGDQIWVQSGTYGPISLKNAIKIIGGFAGTETSASQSDPTVNATVIDGGGARAVVSTVNDSATVLRGFRIVNGDEGTMDEGGGGMLIEDSNSKIVECIFESNLATWWGAAVAIRGDSSPEFVNCTFRNNGWVDSEDNTKVRPLAGAAVYLHSGSPTFTNCLFHENIAGEGAVLANYEDGTATFINCTLEDNDATIGYGGAVHDEAGKTVIRNSILWGNNAPRGGSQIWNLPDGPATTVTYSDVQGGWTGTGNIDADPKFQDSANDDYTLLSTSPCRNAGLDSYLPLDVGDLDWDGITDETNPSETIPQDLDGCKRERETSVDMGAYEYQDSGCCEDGDCAGGQVCIDYECEECVDDGDCGSGQICCSNACESWECCDDTDCGPVEPFCRTSDHTCVLCLTDQDCAFGCCKPNGTCGSCGGGGGGGTNQSSAPPP